MFFKQRSAANATLSYLFGCAGKAKAVAVDVVAGDEDWFIAEAQQAGARIAYVIDTHVHADHYSGGPELARRIGVPYCVHQSNQGRVSFDFEPLRDGQRLEVGNVLVDVVHTPGHTSDSVCLLVRDMRWGDEPWFVITGDTLFVGAVGRPDQAGSACGAGLSGKPASTIAFERRFNPMLSMPREAFIDALVADIPPQPADMARIVEANLRGLAPQPVAA